MAFGRILYKSFYWRIIQLGSSFLQNILLARLLLSTAYAEIFSLVYIYSLVSGFFTFGLNIGLNYFIARGELSIPASRRLMLRVTGLALIAGTGLLYLFREAFAYPGISVVTMLFFGGCQIVGILLTTLAGTVFTAKERNHVPVQLAVAANIALIVLALIGYQIFSGAQAREYLFGLYFVITLLQGLALLVWMSRLDRRDPRMAQPLSEAPSPNAAAAPTLKPGVSTQALFRFCFLSFVIGFLFLVGGRVTLYLLPYQTTAASLGNYIQIYKCVEYLGFITAFLYYPVVTLAAGNDTTATKDKILLLVRLSNTLVLLVSIGGIALGAWFFPLVFGSSFGGMYAIFWGFIPGMFAICSSSFLTAWYFGVGKPRYNLFSAIIQLATALLLYFVLMPRLGVRGAALAYSGGALASFGYDCWIFRRFHPFGLRDLLWMRQKDWQQVWNFSGQVFRLR